MFYEYDKDMHNGALRICSLWVTRVNFWRVLDLQYRVRFLFLGFTSVLHQSIPVLAYSQHSSSFHLHTVLFSPALSALMSPQCLPFILSLSLPSSFPVRGSLFYFSFIVLWTQFLYCDNSIPLLFHIVLSTQFTGPFFSMILVYSCSPCFPYSPVGNFCLSMFPVM